MRQTRRRDVPDRRAQQDAQRLGLGHVDQVQRDRRVRERLGADDPGVPDARPRGEHRGQRRVGRDQGHAAPVDAQLDLVGPGRLRRG